MELDKNLTQNGLLNWYSRMKKKVEKRWKQKTLFFDIENWLWKYNLGTFWEPGIRTWCLFNLAKNWSNFDPQSRNWITLLIRTYIHDNLQILLSFHVLQILSDCQNKKKSYPSSSETKLLSTDFCFCHKQRLKDFQCQV